MGQTSPKTFEQVRAELSDGQVEALLRKLARAKTGDESCVEEVFHKLLRNELGIELCDQMVKLFDLNGRFIPPLGFKGSFVNANRQYHLVQSPNVMGKTILAALKKAFPGLKFGSVKDFEAAIAKLRQQIGDQPQVSNLRKGVCLPLQLPKLQMGDYGTTLEQILLPGVERAHQAAFPDRRFINCRKGELIGEVNVVEPSHNRLIEMMANGPVNGLYFANPFQGLGIEADREAIKHLPEGFLLTGAIEPAFGLAAYPQVLARDSNTPVLDCAAVSWRSSLCLSFSAYDNDLYFDLRILNANVDCSGGVFFVGQ